jgi:hypothetical protein
MYNLDEKDIIIGIDDTTRQNAVFKEHHIRVSCSVVECIASYGFFLTPLILFKGKHHMAGWNRERKDMEFWYGYSPKGYNNSQLCLEYIKNIFQPETAARYVLYFYNSPLLLINSLITS